MKNPGMGTSLKTFCTSRAPGEVMMRALIVDDQASDRQWARSVIGKMGFDQIDAVSRVDTALLRLEEALEGKTPIPELILLDLGFTDESGFEVLRFWKSNPVLRSRTRVVVWTLATNPPEAELASYFGVEVVPKWTGPAELEMAVKRSSATAQT